MKRKIGLLLIAVMLLVSVAGTALAINYEFSFANLTKGGTSGKTVLRYKLDDGDMYYYVTPDSGNFNGYTIRMRTRDSGGNALSELKYVSVINQPYTFLYDMGYCGGMDVRLYADRASNATGPTYLSIGGDWNP